MNPASPVRPLPDYRSLPEFANRNTHATVERLLQQYLGDLNGKRICDLPCGAGSFSVRLASLGAEPVPVDIMQHEPFYYHADRLQLADADRGIPCADASLDAMVSIEGIEHFENPTQFLRECARVIKADGLVFISTPNVDALRSRKSQFLKGYARFFNPLSLYEKAAGHQCPIDMVFFHGAARRAGLEVVDMAVNRPGRPWLARLLVPLFSRKLPEPMRGVIPLFGDVIIYVLRHKGRTEA
ncbi:MAG: methyltransferase domain-containing protein [Gammaproteobacteria bacterium SHHR-1]|uniref:class I SAM-dependent methyltransferase n=1 Tax=Magnetovirga frankeli TaxID=947516 RepID=UPI00129360EF|nr:methyltransferase domain-containing protein [gamma proteobacterium SS-5]